jgi:hypothetical protein
MALTANTNYEVRKVDKVAVGVMPVAASTHIYAGGIVCRNAAGFLVNPSAVAALRVVGIATREVDNSAGADGALSCEFEYGHDVKLPVGALTVAHQWTTVRATDSNTLNAATADTPNVGLAREIEGSSIWVSIGVAAA